MIEHKSSYSGKVTSISRDWDDHDLVRIEVEDTSTPKPKAKKGMAIPTTSRTHTVSKAVADQLKIGDQVVCETTIRKSRTVKVARKGGY